MKESVYSNNPVFITVSVAEAMKDVSTADYLRICHAMFCAGHYGVLCEEDVAANRVSLDQSEGRIIGAYKSYGYMRQDIFIIAYFSRINPVDLELNNTTILYVDEY